MQDESGPKAFYIIWKIGSLVTALHPYPDHLKNQTKKESKAFQILFVG